VIDRDDAADRPKIYSKEYYDRIRALEDRHWWHAGMRQIAAALLRSEPEMSAAARVLDAGCGTGSAMAWVRTAAGASSVTGIDVSAYALSFCRDRGERSLSQSSVMELPFRDRCFDLVLCNDVLQHLPTDGGDVAALKEIHRVLRPGGLALLRTNSRLGLPGGGDQMDPDFQRYDLGQLADKARGANFVVKRASYANVLPSLYASLKGRLQRLRSSSHGHHHGTVYEGLGIREGIMKRRWLNRLLLSNLACEARYLSRSNRCLPFGHTIVCLALKPR
jgi:ubiquinone/menaquinone biosynthesis C-methylase UbiE